MNRAVMSHRRWLHCDSSHDARPHWELLRLCVLCFHQLFIVLIKLFTAHLRLMSFIASPMHQSVQHPIIDILCRSIV